MIVIVSNCNQVLQLIHSHECDEKCPSNCRIRCARDCINYSFAVAFELFTLSDHDFVFNITCPRGDHGFPALKCVQNRCGSSRCGAKWISKMNCSVNIGRKVEFDEIRPVKAKHSKRRHLIHPQELEWNLFVSHFKKKIMEFLSHSAAKLHQHGKRSRLTKKSQFALKEGESVSS